MRWPEEPCGRCGHDVNDHAEIEGEDIAGSCGKCGCEGFITKTENTEARYEPFAGQGIGAPIIEGLLSPDELADWRATLTNPETWTRAIKYAENMLKRLSAENVEGARDEAEYQALRRRVIDGETTSDETLEFIHFIEAAVPGENQRTAVVDLEAIAREAAADGGIILTRAEAVALRNSVQGDAFEIRDMNDALAKIGDEP